MLDLSSEDHGVLDRFLDTVLECYKKGEIALNDARADIAEAFTLAASDNDKVVRYMKAIRAFYESDN